MVNPRRWLANAGGRRAGRFAANRVGAEAHKLFDLVLEHGESVPLAFVDAYLADRIAAALWPAAVVLGLVISAQFLPVLALSPEADRIIVGMIVLAALTWSVYGALKGACAAWPHLRFWFVTRLPPTRHLRLLIFLELRRLMREFAPGNHFLSAALASFQQENGMDASAASFRIANRLAPVVLRHLSKRTVMLVVPVAAALVYYRMIVYPAVIAHYTAVGPWKIAAYPVAALVDGVAGTGLRAALHGT